MRVQLETINDQNLARLDEYSESLFPCQILQTSAWYNFQKAVSRQARLFSFVSKEKSGWFLGYEYNLALGKKYLYIPRGPILANKELWSSFLKDLKNLLKNKGFTFVRFEPDQSWAPAFVGVTARRVADVQPSRTLHTVINKDEKDILEMMHPKTRYNIRLAIKKGLSFNFDDPDLEGFIKLIKETSQRDNFISHPADYYRQMVLTRAVHLATVRLGKEILAAGLFSRCGSIMTYLHGASSSLKREYMAPYALHWEMIMYAKSQNLQYYDWHGIDDKKWPGFTRFKKGFGGEEYTYPGTFDLVLDRVSYTGYTVVRGLKKIF